MAAVARAPRVRPTASEPAALLLQAPLFRSLAPAAAEALVARARIRQFAPDDVMMPPGDRGDYLRMLVQGLAKVHITSPSGSETILSVLRAGDLFGEHALLPQAARQVAVSAVHPSSVMLLHHWDVRTALGEAELYRGLALLLAERQRAADAGYAALLSSDATERVARRLLDLARVFAPLSTHDRYVGLPIRQRDLAAMAGIARETANRALVTLEVAGAVAMTGRQAIMVSPERLRRWLGEE